MNPLLWPLAMECILLRYLCSKYVTGFTKSSLIATVHASNF